MNFPDGKTESKSLGGLDEVSDELAGCAISSYYNRFAVVCSNGRREDERRRRKRENAKYNPRKGIKRERRGEGKGESEPLG